MGLTNPLAQNREPSFPPFFCRYSQFLLVRTAPDVLGRKEKGAGLADDLFFPVAEESLGPGTPVGDTTFGVHHEDRVIAGALYQQAVTLLATPQVV
jgi:hypothetical protein